MLPGSKNSWYTFSSSNIDKFKILFGEKLLHHLPLMSKVVLELIHCPGIILIDFKSNKQIDTKHFCIFFVLFFVYFTIATTANLQLYTIFGLLEQTQAIPNLTKFEAIHCRRNLKLYTAFTLIEQTHVN